MTLFRATAIYKKLKSGFPRSEGKNLFAVCKLLARGKAPRALAFGGVCEDTRARKWELLCGEYVQVPYRIYFSECTEEQLCRLGSAQRAIYHCIFSRSHDGFVRERHLKELFAAGVPDFALPYVVKSGEDYVVEILQTVYSLFAGKDLADLRKFCGRNIKNVQTCHSRMMSYRQEYYRDICPIYGDYVGKALFEECFGFFKTGQRVIKIYPE
ncbi:MAG: hypothetical protein IJW21_05605 [Clostridia bacterium]|nr:hypothetical protein [Clostridia bacterium]